MPFIDLKVSKKISKAQEECLKNDFGKIIEAIPGKSEDWLMINITDESHLYFKGKNDEPISYLELKVFGNVSGADFEKFTTLATKVLENHLNIKKDHMYFKYEEVKNWGWNGFNF
ncbi:MAG: phenylpyruvate tautomerase MIF-related protein [Anaeroplasmataceae bacterium]